jgi:hypothetical protein
MITSGLCLVHKNPLFSPRQPKCLLSWHLRGKSKTKKKKKKNYFIIPLPSFSEGKYCNLETGNTPRAK